MRRLLPTLILCVAAALAFTRSGIAREVPARQLVDHLYITRSQLPIQTLIVDMEASRVIQQENGGVGNLTPESKDKIFFKQPNKLHIDTIIIDPGGPMDGKQMTVIRDGVNRWMFVSMGQYPVKKGADEPIPTLWLPFNIQKYPQDVHREYALIGKDNIDGVTTDVVRLTDPANPKSPSTVWIDTHRWVPLRLETVRKGSKPGDPDVLVRVQYKEIRQLPDGRFFPFQLERYEGGVLVAVVVYKAVGINEKLPDSLFEPMNRFLK